MSTYLVSATTITETDITTTGNITIGQRVTFTLGGIIDNIISSWIRITGNLNVTGNATASYFIGDGSLLTGISSNSTNLTNYALKNQSETFAGNITTTQTGFFSWLGSLTSRVNKLWVQDIDASGNVNITGNATISGNVNATRLVLAAGSTSPGSASLKLTAQTAPLTTPEQGTFELVNNSLQFTQLVRRRGVVLSQNVLISDTSIVNTASESAPIVIETHGPSYLEVGKSEETVLRGVIRQQAGAGFLQIRVKYADTTIQTIQTNAGSISSGTPFRLEVTGTVRSIGASGTMQFNSVMWTEGVNSIPDSSTLVNIDTTQAQNTTLTFQWTEANANNNITINQGRTLSIEPNR